MFPLKFISCSTGGIERIESERPTVLPNIKSKAHGASPFSVPIFSAVALRLRLIMQKAGYVVGGISEIEFLRMFLMRRAPSEDRQNSPRFLRDGKVRVCPCPVSLHNLENAITVRVRGLFQDALFCPCLVNFLSLGDKRSVRKTEKVEKFSTFRGSVTE